MFPFDFGYYRLHDGQELNNRFSYMYNNYRYMRDGLPLTVFGVAMAMQRHPDFIRASIEAGHEIASHGWRWIHYQPMDPVQEREHLMRAVAIHRELTGAAPLGWYTGRDSPNTRRLVVEHGGFEYDSDYYGDNLPFWTRVECADGSTQPHLVVPYTLDTKDMRFATPQGFNTATQFFEYLRDSFDVLYAQGDEQPRMLSIGMHCRLLGRPGRFIALQRFLDHIARHDRVWVCRRIDMRAALAAAASLRALVGATCTSRPVLPTIVATCTSLLHHGVRP